MGSVNPVVILPKALTEDGNNWAKTYAGSITLGTGQFCTNPGLILGIKSKELLQFIAQVSDAILQIKPSVMLHPNIAGAYETNKQKAISQSDVVVAASFKDNTQTNC